MKCRYHFVVDFGNIIFFNIKIARIKRFCNSVCHFLCISVSRRIEYCDCFFLCNFRCTPSRILFNSFCYIFFKYRSVTVTNHFNIKCRQLFKCLDNKRIKRRYNAVIINFHRLFILIVVNYILVNNCVLTIVCTKYVTAEKCLFTFKICHHSIRPMQIRNYTEFQYLSVTQIKLCTVFCNMLLKSHICYFF